MILLDRFKIEAWLEVGGLDVVELEIDDDVTARDGVDEVDAVKVEVIEVMSVDTALEELEIEVEVACRDNWLSAELVAGVAESEDDRLSVVLESVVDEGADEV